MNFFNANLLQVLQGINSIIVLFERGQGMMKLSFKVID